MKKKTICFILAFALILTSTIIYFIPVKLSACLGDGSKIIITVSEMGVSNGTPFINPVSYADITEEQKESILALCSQYSYRRTIHTLFSDGSMSEIGDKLVYIYVNDENDTVITVSSTGKIAVKNRTFKMKHADLFINRMTEILGK